MKNEIKTMRKIPMKRLLGTFILAMTFQGSLLTASSNREEWEQKNTPPPSYQDGVGPSSVDDSLLIAKNWCEGTGSKKLCLRGATGPTGVPGPVGNPGPNFGQYACLYNNVAQTLSTGQNVLFANQISLSGIEYDSTTGVFTLAPGVYCVTYFSDPDGPFNLIANGSIVTNSPLSGSATILLLTETTNTLALQALSIFTLSAASPPLCNVMVTIYQIN